MSATTSAATGRCFGIQRVCQVWERSRSALYARRARAHHRLGAGPARRGPPPRQSDAQLLAAIRTDLARSPFHGEGHRKVHARLRILDGIRVAREEETQLPGESRGCALVFALGQKGFCEVIPAGTAAQAKPNLAGAAEPETDDACL